MNIKALGIAVLMLGIVRYFIVTATIGVVMPATLIWPTVFGILFMLWGNYKRGRKAIAVFAIAMGVIMFFAALLIDTAFEAQLLLSAVPGLAVAVALDFIIPLLIVIGGVACLESLRRPTT